MNLAIWNNRDVHQTTEYSIIEIMPCLYDLSVFISTNLQPNRLECFDVEALKQVVIYDS